MDLPKVLCLSDIDGTIIPDDPNEAARAHLATVSQFRHALKRMEKMQGAFGFCSDSSIEAIQSLAQTLGLPDCPILAENGDVVYYQKQLCLLGRISQYHQLRNEVLSFVAGLKQFKRQSVSPTVYYTRELNVTRNEWAEDPGRIASIAIYGPPSLITMLGNRYGAISGTVADISPDYYFFALHDKSSEKARTLKYLKDLGHSITMIGNSNADFVSPGAGLQMYFVGGDDLVADKKYQDQATYISPLPRVEGIIDILEQI
ncbi:MAG TPA: HAD hydrolase family protein [Terrimicrobiaceae bacterium]